LRFLVSPCAYKGTLSAWQLSQAMADGIRDAKPDAEIIIAPIADGGDGTLDALYGAIGGEFKFVDVHGPVNNPVRAKWLQLGKSAVVELANASGLAILPGGELSALSAHTFGLGEVILNALTTAPEDLFICVGGSASTDGGAGAIAAMGGKFYDVDGNPVALGGGQLCDVRSCDLSQINELLEKSKLSSIKVAVDVINPLLGTNGAAAIFGPQKGASLDDVARLDHCLAHFAQVLESTTGRDCKNIPGAGAAGGTAFGIAAALGAEMISGFSWLAAVLNLEEKIAASDIVFTAEGSLDSQSMSGKAIGELSKLCTTYKKPLWAFPAVAEEHLNWIEHGVQKLSPTSRAGKLADIQAVRSAVCDALT
jgi:glycerate 2-kinase